MAQKPKPPADEGRPEFVSVKTAATVLDVSIWTVYKLVGDGSLKATKIRSEIKIKPEWLDAYIASLPAYAPDAI